MKRLPLNNYIEFALCLTSMNIAMSTKALKSLWVEQGLAEDMTGGTHYIRLMRICYVFVIRALPLFGFIAIEYWCVSAF